MSEYSAHTARHLWSASALPGSRRSKTTTRHSGSVGYNVSGPRVTRSSFKAIGGGQDGAALLTLHRLQQQFYGGGAVVRLEPVFTRHNSGVSYYRSSRSCSPAGTASRSISRRVISSNSGSQPSRG